MSASCLKLRRDTRGVTAVEFALVLPIVLFMIFGTMQLCYIAFVQNRMEAAVREGARLAITGDPGTFTNREDLVTDYITNVMNSYAHVATPAPSVKIETAPTFSAYASAPPLEPLVTDVNGNGICDPADHDTYLDYDGDGTRNTIHSIPGAGKPNEIVRYTASFGLKTFMPFIGLLFGTDGHVMITARTIARNEQFGNLTSLVPTPC